MPFNNIHGTKRQIDINEILQQGKIFDFDNIEYWHNSLPDNGIYLMMEKTENNRISRIGINKKKKLENRLLKHINGNIGNSIFRKHLYRILKSEDKVSKYVKENIRFYVINDPDNRREDIEKKLISYFSNIPLKNVSKNWLGLRSDNKRISSCGLWNVQHVFSEFELLPEDLMYIKENLK